MAHLSRKKKYNSIVVQVGSPYHHGLFQGTFCFLLPQFQDYFHCYNSLC